MGRKSLKKEPHKKPNNIIDYLVEETFVVLERFLQVNRNLNVYVIKDLVEEKFIKADIWSECSGIEQKIRRKGSNGVEREVHLKPTFVSQNQRIKPDIYAWIVLYSRKNPDGLKIEKSEKTKIVRKKKKKKTKKQSSSIIKKPPVAFYRGKNYKISFSCPDPKVLPILKENIHNWVVTYKVEIYNLFEQEMKHYINELKEKMEKLKEDRREIMKKNLPKQPILNQKQPILNQNPPILQQTNSEEHSQGNEFFDQYLNTLPPPGNVTPIPMKKLPAGFLISPGTREKISNEYKSSQNDIQKVKKKEKKIIRSEKKLLKRKNNSGIKFSFTPQRDQSFLQNFGNQNSLPIQPNFPLYSMKPTPSQTNNQQNNEKPPPKQVETSNEDNRKRKSVNQLVPGDSKKKKINPISTKPVSQLTNDQLRSLLLERLRQETPKKENPKVDFRKLEIDTVYLGEFTDSFELEKKSKGILSKKATKDGLTQLKTISSNLKEKIELEEKKFQDEFSNYSNNHRIETIELKKTQDLREKVLKENFLKENEDLKTKFEKKKMEYGKKRNSLTKISGMFQNGVQNYENQLDPLGFLGFLQ